jgi:transglutaminase-like putative cysteine protease
VDFVVGLNARLANEIGYVIRMEPGVQTPEETFQPARDRAATPAGCWCRHSGISGFAARFVSGYLIQLKPDLVA